MKASAKTRKNSKNASNSQNHSAPQVRERDLKTLVKDLYEMSSKSPLVKNSYVLSRAWAWCSKIRTQPRLSIPVPRIFTIRDP